MRAIPPGRLLTWRLLSGSIAAAGATGRRQSAAPGAAIDAREDLSSEDLDLIEPVGKAHPEVEDQEVAADLLIALNSTHDVVRRAGEDRAIQLVDRREGARLRLDPE